MEDIEIDKHLFLNYLKKEIGVFKIVGLNLIEEKPKNSTIYKMYLLMVSLGCVCFINSLQVIKLFFYEEDFFKRTVERFMLATTISSIKLCLLYKNKTNILDLLSQASDLEFLPKNVAQMSLVSTRLKFHTRTTVVFISLTSVAAILNLCRPYFTTKRTFPLEVWYPFDAYQTPFYQILYFHQIIALLGVCLTMLWSEIIIGALTNFIGIQCELLCDNLSHINEYQSHKKLTMCVNHHKKILR